MLLVPSFSPLPRFVRVPCCPEHIARLPLSFLPICFLSARVCLFSRPPPVSIPHIVCPPLSVRRKATNPPTLADQCLLLFSFPSVPYAGLHPPPTGAAGGTWLGCGWGGEGDGAPRGGCESLDSSGRRRPGKRAFVDARILSRVLRCPSLFLPPLPLSHTTVLVPLLSLLTGEYFRGCYALPCSAGPGRPAGCFDVSSPRPFLPPTVARA